MVLGSLSGGGQWCRRYFQGRCWEGCKESTQTGSSQTRRLIFVDAMLVTAITRSRNSLRITYTPEIENIRYTYDEGAYAIGRLSRVTDSSGSTSYGYDARGNVTRVAQNIDGLSYTQTYRYNGANRLIGMTYPSGRTISYSLDAAGRVNTVDSSGGGTAQILAENIEHLPFGPIVSLTLGNGIVRTRAYDRDYRVENLSAGAALSRGLGYDAVGNIAAITDSIDSDQSQLLLYDDLDRLEFASGHYGEHAYGYDGIGNRLWIERDGVSESYGYNDDSHRLQVKLTNTMPLATHVTAQANPPAVAGRLAVCGAACRTTHQCLCCNGGGFSAQMRYGAGYIIVSSISHAT